jgi:hypothetical protein
MNEIELTQLFVEYAELNKKAQEVKAKIEKEILERGQTSKMAGVTATYYKPSFETPDYESAAKASLPKDFDLSPYTSTTVTTRWKEVCETIGVVAPAGAEKPARVVVKV